MKEGRNTGKYDVDHTVAVIYRTNAQSRALEEACVRNNVPYVIFGSSASFYKRQEIKDSLCFLRWLHNGRDRSAMLRAMTTPKRGIGDAAIEEFEAYCAAVESYYAAKEASTAVPTPLDVLISLADDNSRDSEIPTPQEYLSKRSFNLFTPFARQMKSIRQKAEKESLEKVLEEVVKEFDLMTHLDKISKSTSEFQERKANVEELMRAAEKYTANGPCLGGEVTEDGIDESPLTSFLDDVALVTDMAERSAEERFVVNLMTIHASKGMEFDTVFVVGNEDGTLPTSQVSLTRNHCTFQWTRRAVTSPTSSCRPSTKDLVPLYSKKRNDFVTLQ